MGYFSKKWHEKKREKHFVCYGFYKDSIRYGQHVYSAKFLYSQNPATDDDGIPQWGVEPQTIVPKEISDVTMGSIRHQKCTHVTHNDNGICSNWLTIPSTNSLRLRVIRHRAAAGAPSTNTMQADKQQLSKTNNKFLVHDKLALKAQIYRKRAQADEYSHLNQSQVTW